MCLHLNLLKIWLSSHLSLDALILTPWSVRLVCCHRLIGRHCWRFHRFVPLNLKVEFFDVVKRHSVIKIYYRLAIYIVHKGSDIGLKFDRHHNIWLNHFGIEAELKPDVSDVIGLLLFTPDLGVLGCFTVLGYPLLAVLPRLDVLLSYSGLELTQPLTGSNSDHNLVSVFKENVNQPFSHSKMVVLINVPLWLHTQVDLNWHNDFISVNFG